MADPNLPANNASDTKRQNCQMRTVPELVRFNKHTKEDYYTPKMVSFGPYYHGLPELRIAEELKRKVLEEFVSSTCIKSLENQILGVIDQIRNRYVGVSKIAYDDKELAEMMLLDASFAIYIMKIELGCSETFEHSRWHLGIAATPCLSEDLILFNNQIPLLVIKLLCDLMHGSRCTLIYDFLSFFIFRKKELIRRIPGEDEWQPLHLLDASYQLLVKHGNETTQENSNEYDRQSLSVTALKAKGIHFKPSSYSLKDIKFESFKFYGQLQLPIFFFNANSKLRFTQMIEHEMTLEEEYDFTFLCYVNFMKSLIVKSEDVKELREKKILFSDLDSDEQIVEVIKGIDTHRLGTDFLFDEEKKKIVKHCSSKAKTCIAELFHTHFRSLCVPNYVLQVLVECKILWAHGAHGLVCLPVLGQFVFLLIPSSIVLGH
ncbi:UPF0481 protein At3g47200-like [Olea europaea var. sylvestris]|uniref:UPF0481 protein At3g47200-like n=1 Tax=Olea europaea var. sylvestris TaxID=158386 RepID=UPI000C1D55BE|nr:UPF0481 protein At3g47200-like [Olea europaea var. sylvestris]